MRLGQGIDQSPAVGSAVDSGSVHRTVRVEHQVALRVRAVRLVEAEKDVGTPVIDQRGGSMGRRRDLIDGSASRVIIGGKTRATAAGGSSAIESAARAKDEARDRTGSIVTIGKVVQRA